MVCVWGKYRKRISGENENEENAKRSAPVHMCECKEQGEFVCRGKERAPGG